MSQLLTLNSAAALVLGYLLGSIPFGLIITRLAGLGDVRAIGSGNIGATNVLRTGRRGLAGLTLLGDAVKGAVAVLVAAAVWGPFVGLIAGFAAFLGHLFPVWLKFRGGKGVATYLGVLAAASWPAAVTFAAVWLAMATALRFSSLSALLASLAAAVFLFALDERATALLFLAMTAILWLRHASNLRRLFDGTESRIGER